MPPEITALINLIGAPAAIVLLLTLRDWYQGRSEAKQSNAITDIAVNEIAERKQLQESNNRLQAEVFAIRLEQAKEAGRREEMRITSDKNEAKIVTLEARILELEKHQQQSKERIQELEAEIELLNKKLAEANAEISLLQAQKRELESQLEIQRSRADAISRQLQTVQEEAAQASTATLSVDDTATPAISANTQPLPENVTTGNDEADEPAA